MSSIDSIVAALPGERVVGLTPGNATDAASTWLRRPHLFPGRALTVGALDARQQWQAGRIVERAACWLAGIDQGLEVQFSSAGAGGLADVRISVERGLGLTAWGEDVVLQRPLACALTDLPVVAPASFFVDGSGVGNGAAEGVLHPRGIGATLGTLLPAARAALPAVGVLVLQPVQVDGADLDPLDPCDRSAFEEGAEDPTAFEDWRRSDAVRLLWYVWPAEWRRLPVAPAVPAAQHRNALAWTVFGAEAALSRDDSLPWDAFGVPIAMVALDTAGAGSALWLDRASVARRGGRARDAHLRSFGPAHALAADPRLPPRWQAQIEQLAEQLAATPGAGAVALAAGIHRHLPPVGLLPREVYDTDTQQCRFFPPAFDVDAVPVPVEQLDVALRASASLAPLDRLAEESVRLMLPVPLAHWEPRLLLREFVDAEFQQTLDRFLLARARSLGGRQGLRHKAALLTHALDGRVASVPDWRSDAAATETESLSPWGPPPPGGGHRSALMAGLHQHAFDGARTPFVLTEGDELFVWVCLDPDHPPRTLMLQWHQRGAGSGLGSWEHRAYWGDDAIPLGALDGPGARVAMGALPTAGQWVRLGVPMARLGLARGAALDGMAFSLVDGRAAFGLAAAGNAGRWRKWFCNFLPEDARAFGNEAWELLSANDLWVPFDPPGGVVTSLPAIVSEGGSDSLFGGGAGGASTYRAVPTSGFNLHYAAAGGWRGHGLVLVEPQPSLALTATSGSPDRLLNWVYLDELAPPRSVLAYHLSRALDAGGNPTGETRIQLLFWGENRLRELVEQSPVFAAFAARAVHVGPLPPTGRWIELEVPVPESAPPTTGRARLQAIAFLVFDGDVAFSELHVRRGVASGTPPPPERLWPRSFEGDTTVPPVLPVFNPRLRYQHNLGVLTPTPSSRIGTVAVMRDLVDDPLIRRLGPHEQTQLPLRGLTGFADFLRRRIDRADDITDFGFAHMQVDIHRMRQLTMSTTDAARLAVSPALAAIAKSDSALVVQGQIGAYLARVRGSGAAGTAGAAAGAASAAAAAPSGATVGAATEPMRFTMAATTMAARLVTDDAASRAGFAAETGTTAARSAAVAGAAMTAGLRADTGADFRAGAAGAAGVAASAAAAPVSVAAAVAGNARLIAAPRAPLNIVYAQPVVGLSEIRTTAIADRLRAPPSTEARDYALANRERTVRSLLDLLDSFMAEDNGAMPGLLAGFEVYGLPGDPFLAGAPGGGTRRPLVDFRANPALVTQLRSAPPVTPPPVGSGAVDEASLFTQTVALSDCTIAMLRQLEARLVAYRDALSRTEAALSELLRDIATGDTRLAAIEDALAEARHDVGVARALLAEETERVDAVNTRRRRVLAEELKFVAYVRPRECDNLLATPTHAVDPALAEPPVPACLREHPDLADELVDMLAVLREAPAQWFVRLPALLGRFDRIEQLQRGLASARGRAVAGLALPVMTAAGLAAGAPRLLQAAARVSLRQAEALAPRIAALRAIEPAGLAAAGWAAAQARARELLSFGDLAEGGHGRSDIARQAASELEQIRRIVACLHAEFSGTPAALRLAWAETLSQFDAAPDLRQLASLARWSEIDVTDRRQMQAYVDWLFAQVEPGQPQAVALVNDIVRMCLLIASHAPVGRIVSGRLARPVTGVGIGTRLPLQVLAGARLRVGMQAVLMRGTQVMARALVEDLGSAEVSARVVHVAAARIDLGDDVRVQFDDAATISLAAAGARRSLFGR